MVTGKVTKSDNYYLAAQITSFIVRTCLLCNRQCVGSSVIFGLNFPTIRVILSRKRGRAELNKYSSKLKSSSNKERDTGKPNCGLMNLMVSMLRRNLTQEEDANFISAISNLSKI